MFKALKKVSVLFMILMGIVVLALPLQAQEAITIRLDGDTNIRSGPGREYMIRGVVPARSSLTITGRTDFEANDFTCIRFASWPSAWVRVDFDGIEGWVRYCTGDVDGDVNTLPIVEPANAVMRRALSQYGVEYGDSVLSEVPDSNYVLAMTRYNRIHVYTNPALDAEIVDWLSSDMVYVTGVSADREWFYVEYEGRSVFDDVSAYEGPQSFEGWVFHDTLRMPGQWALVVPVK